MEPASTNDNGNFWGIDKNGYTPDYEESVQRLVSDPTLLDKALTDLKSTGYVNSKDDLLKYASDMKVGPVHKYIKKFMDEQPAPAPAANPYTGYKEDYLESGGNDSKEISPWDYVASKKLNNYPVRFNTAAGSQGQNIDYEIRKTRHFDNDGNLIQDGDPRITDANSKWKDSDRNMKLKELDSAYPLSSSDNVANDPDPKKVDQFADKSQWQPSMYDKYMEKNNPKPNVPAPDIAKQDNTRSKFYTNTEPEPVKKGFFAGFPTPSKQ
jgi:hypothetical protein